MLIGPQWKIVLKNILLWHLNWLASHGSLFTDVSLGQLDNYTEWPPHTIWAFWKNINWMFYWWRQFFKIQNCFHVEVWFYMFLISEIVLSLRVIVIVHLQKWRVGLYLDTISNSRWNLSLYHQAKTRWDEPMSIKRMRTIRCLFSLHPPLSPR